MSLQVDREAPRLFHTMRCNDAEAMIAWLKDVLGFSERVVYRRDGIVAHAELALGSSILMLGAQRDDAYAKRVGEVDGRRTDAVYLAVDDPDALYEKVKTAGARIELEPYNTDYGSRDFSARDPEGGLWSFGTYWPKVGDTPLPD
ncbi:VOC family protein [Bradyrhizobium symbiodeficiens]|uniref:VOC family protein n=1 Tax=Bradyrhizobium symbiodeficiens TaxID=1404367 RepID=A0A6G9A3V2_9BRAD|nr:VOC family protein [Bradyrhizobium symbiodeficiens]QDF40714.1 glyoxalase [Bradyrhizobium symbiodeficiens]QIP07157.1 glyoxalase [Bradyrhizobium symbiodeficiens]